MIKGEKDIEDLDVKGMTIINLCHLFQFLASTFTCPFLLTAIDVDDREGKVYPTGSVAISKSKAILFISDEATTSFKESSCLTTEFTHTMLRNAVTDHMFPSQYLSVRRTNVKGELIDTYNIVSWNFVHRYDYNPFDQESQLQLVLAKEKGDNKKDINQTVTDVKTDNPQQTTTDNTNVQTSKNVKEHWDDYLDSGKCGFILK